MKLHIAESTGVHSLTSAMGYVNDLSAIASDLRPFFHGIEKDLIQEVQHEFDASNPNKWKRISRAWKEQKRSEGAPENIGIYTGALMRASSTEAIKKYYATTMTWEIADCYSIGFTERRKIGITASEWLRGLGNRIVRTILARLRR